jgi:Tol biopolymer transport system component
MLSRVTAVLASTLFCVLVFGASAHAAFPGANGKIVYAGGYIYTVDPDGSNPTQLSGGAGGNTPTWSPDGSLIAYGGTFIGVMNADGSGAHFITTLICGGCQDELSPSWSPDATRIVYEYLCTRCGPTGQADLRVVNVDGTGDTALTTDHVSNNPEWSPDGTKIAYGRSGVGLFTMNPDGSGVTQIPNTVSGDSYPSWSPDGKQLAFTRNTGGGHGDLFKINLDGSGLQQLTSNGSSVRTSAWSPDGKKIAYWEWDFTGPQPQMHVLTINADGTNRSRLNLSSEARDPDWQPIPGPRRSDYKNAAQFCKSERAFLGSAPFRHKYGGPKGNGANAFGKCVSRN